MTQETLASIALVKAFSREPFVDEIFERENAANLKASLAAAAVEAKFAPVVRVLMAVGSVIVLCFGVVRVREGVLSAGDLWVFLSYFRNLRGPLKELSNALRRLARAEVRWERVRDLFDTALPTDDRTRLPAPRFTGHVTMRDVDFEYTPGVPVLRRLSLEVAAGEGVAIIGATGAGKSTLVSLIAALYEPTRGTVAIDRHDLATLRPDSVREQIAFVLQETVLFATTVRENIAYGRLDATEDEIVAAARAARIHDFVMTLPEGYETIVGERGATLSGGQRQRIAIARAILRDARILILDEPTTGLDLQTEREVWEQLKTLMRGRTTVLISHHPHLARDMDRVYHLADGQVVEERNVA
jgi:ATP-binding cassette subfamily B protein